MIVNTSITHFAGRSGLTPRWNSGPTEGPVGIP
jgi:hypothetical protein